MATPPVIVPARVQRGFWIFLLAVLFIPTALLSAGLLGVRSLFRPSAEVRALRDSLLAAGDLSGHPRISLNLGWFSLGTLRTIGSFLVKEPEALAAMCSLRGAEVCVGELAQDATTPDYAAIMAAADRAMSAQGWERVVVAIKRDKLAAVYISSKGNTSKRMRCCMVASDGHYLVLAAATASLEPLLELVSQEQPWRFN